jgi:hypothetical protein
MSCLLHFLVPGTGTVFRIRFRFRCRIPQINTVPTGSGSGILDTLVSTTIVLDFRARRSIDL